MLITQTQYNDLSGFAYDTVHNSYRCSLLIRKSANRDWLARTAVEGIQTELHNFNSVHTASLKEALRERVYDHVIKANVTTDSNGEPTFVISTIILMAVLSWLIQKLLNHFFPNV